MSSAGNSCIYTLLVRPRKGNKIGLEFFRGAATSRGGRWGTTLSRPFGVSAEDYGMRHFSGAVT